MLTVTVLLKDPETVLQPEAEALPDSLALNVEVIVPEGQLEEDMLGELEVVVVSVTSAVGLTLVVVDKDTLSVPVLQNVLDTDELGVEEREGERVGDTVKVVDTVGDIETLAEPLGEVVLVKQVVGEPDWVAEVLAVTVLQNVPEDVPHPEADTLLD